ncbi:cysteine desulfurase-like protein [Vibrio tapetis]|nr:cysteine desulfurase-like protein [Vibrio tapetis]
MAFSVDKVRSQFPALEQSFVRSSNAIHGERHHAVFLDGPGGSQVPLSVLDAMHQYLGHYNSNLGGHFFSSQITSDLMLKAREAAQSLLNAPSSKQIVFGANMTSLTFQLSRAISRDWNSGDEIIVTDLDHYANVSPWKEAAQDKGVNVLTAGVTQPECQLDMNQLESLISAKTKLIAVTMASNTTGSVVDIATVVRMAKQVGAMVYVDAVHYAPHQLIDVQALGCDFLVCSAYKFFGPHLGLAYVAAPWIDSLAPYKVEPAPNTGPNRFETGTQNFEALAGFCASVDYLAQWGAPSLTLRERLKTSFEHYTQHESELSDYFLARFSSLNGATLYGLNRAGPDRTPTFAFRLDSVSPEQVAKKLGEEHICVWNGHFYAIGLVRTLGYMESGGVIRVGLMHYNTKAEIDRLFDVLKTLA